MISESLLKIKKIYQKTKLEEQTINKVIQEVANQLILQKDFILSENQKDLDKMSKADPKYDRLLLNESRLKDISNQLNSIASYPTCVGLILEKKQTKTNLTITKVSCPIGLIGVIYEARPNVTPDVFAICLKSHNACVLKGGSDAENSNNAIVKIIHEALVKYNLPKEIVYIMPSDRKYIDDVIKANGIIDLCIPRGGKGLIEYVRKNATVPVIETGAGVVHMYIDEDFNLEYAKNCIFNSKTRRVSVCNALDSVLIHKNAINFLPKILEPLESKNVKLYCDNQAFEELKDIYPFLYQATQEDFGREFLDYAMSVKVVKNIEEAIEHIETHSSHHSDCIISENKQNIELFQASVDSAVVYINTPTSFTDGGEFEMGAEIGNSTQKLHARGPMSVKEMTSYKWIVSSKGVLRK